jgi:hypothetical protein
MSYSLTDIDIEEVSLVDRPAIKRKFLVVKAEEDNMPEKDDLEMEDGLDKAKHPPFQSDDEEEDEEEEMPKKKRGKMKKDDSEGGISKSEFESILKGMETKYENLLKSAQSRVDELEKSVRFNQFRDHVVTKNWPGAPEDNISLMEKMSQALDPETYKEWLDREDTRAAELAKSSLFDEIGANHTPSNDSLTDEVAKAVAEGKPYEEILRIVQKDPKSYVETMKSHDKRVRDATGGY